MSKMCIDKKDGKQIYILCNLTKDWGLGGFSSDLYRGSLKHTKPKKGFRLSLLTVGQRFFIISVKCVTRPPQFGLKMGKKSTFVFFVTC